MGVAQAGGLCSDRDFVVIAPVCAVVEIDLLGFTISYNSDTKV